MSGPARPRWRARHRAQVDAVLAEADPDEIRRLYRDLGDLFEDEFAADLDRVPQLSVPENVAVVTGLLDGVDGVVLDAGCGPNPVVSISLARARPPRAVIALDIGLGTVRLARACAGRAGASVIPLVADVERLPFRADALDGIACDDTIEHVPGPDVALAELVRVVRPSAPVVVVTPNRHSIAVLARRALDLARGRRHAAEHYFAAESHLREYTWRELDELAARVGATTRHATVGWSGSVLRRLVSRLVRLPLARRFDRMLVICIDGPTGAPSLRSRGSELRSTRSRARPR